MEIFSKFKKAVCTIMLTSIMSIAILPHASYAAETTVTETQDEANVPMQQHITKQGGVFYGPSGKETYYNLNMSGIVKLLKSMQIQGDYWIREDGAKMYGNYVLCAADLRKYARGTIIQTSLGKAIVADTGSFTTNGSGVQVDLAVAW